MLELLRDLLRKAFEKISRLRITGTTVQPGGLVLSKAVLEGLLSESQEWESMISKRLVIIALSKLLNDSSAVDQWQRPLTRLLDPIAATPPVDIEQINADELIFEKLPCSEIMYARGTTRYLIDKLPFNPPSKSRTNEKFKVFQSGAFDTVRMLQHADPRLMSILNCSGVRKTDGQELDIQLMYPIPDNLLQPRSLRDLLTSNDGSDRDGEIHALDDRYQMANQIATAVLYVHSGNFVHKRIKPENIVVFSTDTDRFPHSLGYSIVTGFNRTRTTETSSFMIGDIKLEDCLYQHPNRWGVVAESKYKMLHDVYSLGVVLLEIGLWKPFVRWGAWYLLEFIRRFR